MNVLEKILEEIERLEDPYYKDYVDRKYVKEIIHSHMDDVPDNNAGWIPVSERLPEEGDGKYYPLLNVQTSYGAVKRGFYRVRDDRWYIYEEFYNEFIETNKKEVVAWHMLPEPYKEG